MCSPEAIAGHACACAAVGSAKARVNQSRTCGVNGERGIGGPSSLLRTVRYARAMRSLGLVLLSVGMLGALGGVPATAGAVDYSVSISGRQDLEWKLDGTRGNCELRRGAGSGKVSFRFASRKAAPAAALARGRGMFFATSIPSTATGTLAGAFTDTVAAACPGFVPSDPVTDPTGGCGPVRFGVRVDFQYRSDGFVYVTGPNAPLGPVSLAQAGGECPFPLGGRFDETSDRKACGDGAQQWQRSYGVSYAGGQGLFSSRFALKPRALLRPRKKTIVLTGKAVVDCTVPSSYSGGVKITGKLTYAMTLKRR